MSSSESNSEKIEAVLGGGFKDVFILNAYLGKIPILTNSFKLG